MKIEEQRKDFEEWFEKNHNGRQISCDWVELDKSYSSGYSNALWVGWIASANRQWYKLVPVEPSKEMYLAGTHELTQIDFRDLHDNDSVSVYKAMIGACDES